ncbi:tRNA wybutosine-synthesizing protein 3 homolog isoform X2 [Corythoichthys intestinalis]|uniref:tRNA wybutosine-synthesizing protein 3 homolog isoform X2 n=1 Tax=Corythoichthys intestinalis TaxID=161448 RepID=UPI0025A52547|nr:tRNA wybutosine-synthesizing protein 3 homolog isoform X2 [Corythoichthys intestinalis]XP_061794950.1 tRNA wybutosine-synthesizing protein 3 homolog [Nerophis lumbriciformis]
MEKTFSEWKKRCLNKADLSKKANVDEDIVDLVSMLNSCEEYFTTSSCSGRITVMETASESCVVQKKNLTWLFVSHQKCKFDDVMTALANSCGNAVLKFEPFVLHVQCRTLENAQLLLSGAVQSGFRNSGITLGKTGKIMMAVRCTHGLEVPLSKQGSLLVSQEYIQFLIEIANQKLEENQRRIERFHQRIQTTVMTNKHQKPPDKEEKLVTKDNISIKQSRQTDDCHSDESIIESDEDLHLVKWFNGAL